MLHEELDTTWRRHLPARILESSHLAETALMLVLENMPVALSLLPNTSPRQYYISAVKGFDNQQAMLLPALVVRYPTETCPFIDQVDQLEWLGHYLNMIAGITHIFLVCQTPDPNTNNCWHYFIRNDQKHLEVVKFSSF